MAKRYYPENTNDLKDVLDIKGLIGSSELVQLAIEAQGNPTVITLDRPYKMATSVRLIAAIMPVSVYSINQYNNSFYFTEMYSNQMFSPTLYKTSISQGNYSADDLVLALQAAIPAARPANTSSLYNQGVTCNDGPPRGSYNVLFDDLTSTVAIHASDTSQNEGIYVHSRSVTTRLADVGSSCTISNIGTQGQGLTKFIVTTITSHNITTYAIVNLRFTNGVKTVFVNNYLLTTPPPSTNSLVFELRNTDLLGISPNDKLVVTSIELLSDKATMAPCLGFARARDPLLVASGRQAPPLQILNSNSAPATQENDQFYFSMSGAHFLSVGDIVTVAGSRGGVTNLSVDTIETSTTFKATSTTTPPTYEVLNYADSISLRNSLGALDELVRATDKMDLSLHTRAIYVELILGATQVGNIHSTRISGRRYIGKIQMDAIENGIVFEQHPNVRSAIPLKYSTASFQSVTLRLYDSQELLIDMPNFTWSCMIELEARA